MEADALSRIDWEKCDESIQANSLQAIVAAAITGHVTNHIEAILYNPQTIDSPLLSIPDTPIVSKAITQSSGQSRPTCLKAESSVSKIVSEPDDHSYSGVDNDPPLNPKCMTTSDWVRPNLMTKLLAKSSNYLKQKSYSVKKIRKMIAKR